MGRGDDGSRFMHLRSFHLPPGRLLTVVTNKTRYTVLYCGHCPTDTPMLHVPYCVQPFNPCLILWCFGLFIHPAEGIVQIGVKEKGAHGERKLKGTRRRLRSVQPGWRHNGSRMKQTAE